MVYGCFSNYGMYGGIFTWLVNILIIGGLVLLIVWLIKKIQNENKSTRRSKR